MRERRRIHMGTGCFLLMNTGDKAVASDNGLLTTIAASNGGGNPLCAGRQCIRGRSGHTVAAG